MSDDDQDDDESLVGLDFVPVSTRKDLLPAPSLWRENKPTGYVTDDPDRAWDAPTNREMNLNPAADGAIDNKIPTVVRCQGCGGELVRDGGWRPPDDADAAWAWAVSCGMACTATRRDADQPWGFCPRTGRLFVDGEEEYRDYERRKNKLPAWDGKERRAAAIPGAEEID